MRTEEEEAILATTRRRSSKQAGFRKSTRQLRTGRKSPRPQEIRRDNRLSQEARFWRFQTKSGNWHGRQYPSCRSLRTGLEPRRLQKACRYITPLSQTRQRIFTMSISKKERTLSIWIGLAIGITLSSLLFRYALNEKEAKTRQRPGNFEGNTTAQGSSFDPIPEAVAKKISGGIVVFFDKNRSICESHAAEKPPSGSSRRVERSAPKDFSSSSSKTLPIKPPIVFSVLPNCM